MPKIAEMFRLVGVEVRTAERPQSELEADLRAGKRFDLAYRATRCEEPVMEAGPLLCPGYDASPSADALASVVSPRILQLLLQLERAPSGRPPRGSSSRSTARPATSCRSCPSGSSKTITPGAPV